MNSLPVALGLDFGTESVRALLIDSQGNELGLGTNAYQHGQIVEVLPTSKQSLPDKYALQCPSDWIESASIATQAALKQNAIDPNRVVGIGVDFTSCTMLPTKNDGTPLCEIASLKDEPLAWPKLWKHHGALAQTDRMNAIARDRNEPFLDRYGGTIGLEWFFPKMLETIEVAPHVSKATDVWLEAGDWFVWKLVGCDASQLPRSTCQAGYKGLWSARDGYANLAYFEAVHPELAASAKSKMPGRLLSPGQAAGDLCPVMAKRLGLNPGTIVSAATIDAHAAVPGVGAADAGVMVLVMGTSSCHMLNSTSNRSIQGVAGIVEGGILPGYFGYETGQAAVGDAFAWLLNLLNLKSFDELGRAAQQLPPGSEGVSCLDWFNGCRTPWMDGSLTGMFTGLTLNTTPAHLYRSLLEASACGVRWIVELLRDGGVPVKQLVATGGLPHHNPAMVQVYADVLNMPIEVHPSQHGPAAGAAVLGMFAAGEAKSGFQTISEAISAMTTIPPDRKKLIYPNTADRSMYDVLYRKYRNLAEYQADSKK